jgi:hypothetical protein
MVTYQVLFFLEKWRVRKRLSEDIGNNEDIRGFDIAAVAKGRETTREPGRIVRQGCCLG